MPFAEVAPFLRSAPIVFGNLETPLVHAQPGSLFAAPPRAAAALRRAGFTLLSVANNHAYDHGAAGLASTLDLLQGAGLAPLGAGSDHMAGGGLVRTDAGAIRLGWLGRARTRQLQAGGGPYYRELDEAELLASVRQARPQVDVLAVSIHLGYMYLDYPHPDDRAMALRLAAAGADLVLTHHAHVLQGVEVTAEGRVLCYNLGNLLIDWQEGNVRCDLMAREQNEGAVFAFDLDRRGVSRLAVLPTYIDDECCVRWATGERGQAILDRLARISRDLHGDYAPAFRRQRAERNSGHALKVVWFHLRRGHWAVVRDMIASVRPDHVGMLAGSALGRLRSSNPLLRTRASRAQGSRPASSSDGREPDRSATPAFTICQIGAFHAGAGKTPTNADSLAHRLAELGIESVCASTHLSPLRRSGDMLRTLVSQRCRFRVVLVHVYSGRAFLWALSSVLVAKLLAKRVVLWLHGGNLPAYRQAHPRLLSLALDRADRLIAPSGYLAGAFADRYQVDVLPYELPVGLYPFHPRDGVRPRLLWLRAFDDIYNPALAPQVVSLLAEDYPGVHLTMCGPDNRDGTYDATRQLAIELGVSDRIDFPGLVSKDRIRHLGAEADIFINTTNYDNTPVSVIEAMAMGMCVVSTDVGGVPFLVRDGQEGLLVPPRDAAAMAAACRRLLTDPALAGRLSRGARARAMSFDWQAIAPRWLALLRGLHEGRPHSSDPASGARAPRRTAG